MLERTIAPCAVAAMLLAGLGHAASFREQVEADWLLQDDVRGRGSIREAYVKTWEDAAGAVDGRKTGKWAFHTNLNNKPWWHVDLGKSQPLDRVEIWNRTDGVAARASRLIVLLSDDAKQWRQVYQHNGKVFYGFTDKKPLVVDLKGEAARWLRIQLPGKAYLHLDEVEVYAKTDPKKNIALRRPANQSSVSQWSSNSLPSAVATNRAPTYKLKHIVARGLKLAAALDELGVETAQAVRTLNAVAAQAKGFTGDTPLETRRAVYMKARWTVRRLALSNPLLNFDEILVTKRQPGSFSHMSDQYYGWWSRPGGGIYRLSSYKTNSPKLRRVIEDATGSFLRPDLSYDGKRILYAHCKYYPQVAGVRNKMKKEALPEDAFYNVFEVGIDGQGVRQLTRGRYDDFDARYLPDGRIVFLSTRRGQFLQCSAANTAKTLAATLGDSYVRCGGGNSRPVAVYTLHVMNADGRGMHAISAFENFEWTPSIARDGRILYARWDYIDRHNMPYMSLWATNPDGTNPQAVYGNYTKSPHCIFEARAIPNSNKLIFTASAHHAITAGSLVLFDPAVGCDGKDPITRLTPEVRFPETEGWPASYYANPWPLSEDFYLVAWSPQPIRKQGKKAAGNATGIYLYDRWGNLELLYRDPKISTLYPIPLRARPKPPILSSAVVQDDEAPLSEVVVQDVYQGLAGVARGTVKRIRIVGVPAKTQPQMNRPPMGLTRDDPGKFVIGTAPVAADGSAYFRMPAGVLVFFQALDADGLAVQTMRTATYMQAGQRVSCVGCHDPRNTTPVNTRLMATRRAPSKLTPGPEGSWPLRFDKLVQPVLDKRCVQCHNPKGDAKAVKRADLTPAKAYDALVNAGGNASLQRHVSTRYRQGYSTPGACTAATSPVLAMLRKGHGDVKLSADEFARIATWMDLYAQRQGAFSNDQEKRLIELRTRMAKLFTE